VAIQTSPPELPERIGKAFAAFWIGFFTTLALTVGLYRLAQDFLFADGGPYPLPPALGLALSVAAIVVGRYASVASDGFDLKILLQWAGSDSPPRLQSVSRRALPAASNTIRPALNKPVH
jgi:hypothetical protein